MRDEFWLEDKPQGEFAAFGDFMRGERGPEGPMGPAGKSAYQQAVNGGYTGTEEEFNEQLVAYTELTEDVSSVKSAIEKNNSVNMLDNVAVSTSTTAGITFSVIDKQTIHVEGTSTALAIKNIYSSQTMPEWLEKGKQYYLEYSTASENVLFRVYIYRNGTLVSTALVEAVSNQVFTIPTDATGIIFRLAVKKDITVNEDVTFAVLNAPSNSQLTNNIENIYPEILITNSADIHNETVNLLNPNTITEGYILSNNKPVANSSFYYSDYIEIGMNKFCFSQAGNVTDQVNCYDSNKKYIGAIDYTKNTDHFVEGNVGAATDLRFRTFTPLDGTVYIRVNGGLSHPKMVTPFFSPLDYGATAQNLPYLQTFHKWGLKAAMFGDSIMLGRDGNSSSILEKNPVWWVNQLTNLNADNFGVGSMGWVSTRYLSEIAYDKISTTDITSYDLIILCYGVNDTGSTLGSWDSTDETTIMGQVNKCVRYIGSVNPSARIILIAPWNTPGAGTFPDWGYSVQRYSGLTRYDLSNALKQAAEYYKIGFISQIDSPLNGFGLGTAEGVANGPFAGTDGVHPTQEGYAAIGYWLSAKISATWTESATQSEDIDNLKNQINDLSAGLDSKAPALYNIASGVIASFDDGAESMPLKGLTVDIEPVQAGSGDPSPENVRPITGWTGCNVTRAGKNLFNIPSGTLKVGSIDKDTGVIDTSASTSRYTENMLKIKGGANYAFQCVFSGSPQAALYMAYYDSNGAFLERVVLIRAVQAVAGAWSGVVQMRDDASYIRLCGYVGVFTYSSNRQIEEGNEITDYESYQGDTYSITFPTEAGTVYGGTFDVVNRKLNSYPYYSSYNGETIIGPWISSMDVYTPRATPTLGAQVVDIGGAATSYDLSDAPEITTFLGTNNIWADAGSVDVDYCADTKLYIQNIHQPTEDDMIADAQIASGKYFLIGNTLYLSTTVIPAGDTIIPGTNCTKTNLAAALNALNT